jgi:hypothetical protein
MMLLLLGMISLFEQYLERLKQMCLKNLKNQRSQKNQQSLKNDQQVEQSLFLREILEMQVKSTLKIKPL